MINKLFLKKAVTALCCAVVSAVFVVIMLFCPHEINVPPDARGEFIYRIDGTDESGETIREKATAVIGQDVTAISINDLDKLNRITKINYVPNEFISPGRLDSNMQIVELTEPFEFAEKGSIVIIITNLDPEAEDFDSSVDKLAPYRSGDYWHFVLSLPEIFCASNVYLGSTLEARHGEISGYNFIDYTTSYDLKTDKFSAQTDNITLDLQFYTRRVAMDDRLNAAQVITIHYQSPNTAYSGIKDCPLIGDEKTVITTIRNSQTLLISFAIIAAVVFAVFCVMSILEQTNMFVPAVIWIFGIAVMLFANFFLRQVTSAPLLWAALALCTSFIILGGTLLFVGKDFIKHPVKFALPALMLVGAILAFIRPFMPFGAERALNVVCIVIKAVGVTALWALIILLTVKENVEHGILKVSYRTIIAVGMTAALFLPRIFPAQINPMFWLCVATTAVTFVSVFTLFKETKKANVYLTDNLQLEVDRQLKDIKAVIEERDNLLQFVSHDMKKPLQSSTAIIDTLIEREKDAEQTKGLQIVKQHTSRVLSNLLEIGEYSKFNYIAEPSQAVDLRDLCSLLCKYHTFDCNANGIILKNTVDKSFKVFAKKQALENAASNIIINAVEHANCQTITLSAKTDKNKTVLCIADDGKGIKDGLDIFKPYVTENKTEAGGIGLSICKSMIESMNGELTYTSECGNTVFCIALLKA